MAIASAVARSPWAVVLTATLLAAVGVVVALNTIRLDADTNNLIADDRPFMAPFRAWMEEFGDLEYIYVVVDPMGKNANGKLAVEALVDELRNVPELPEVHGWVSGEEQWRLATRAMPETELAELVRAGEALPILASNEDARVVFEEGLRRLEASSSSATRLASGVLLLDAIAGQGIAQPLPAEFLRSENQRLFFVEIMPQKDYGTLATIAKPLSAIRAVIADVNERFPSVEIGITGKPVLQADELTTSDSDMTRAATIALSIITVLFIIVFRGFRRPLLAVLAFAFAFAWTYGAAGILLGRLNLLSMVFMLVLVGVGVDYGIHIVARYAEARRRASPIEAVKEAIRTAGLGNVFGAATSAGVFFLGMATPFGGLQELGEIAGIGLIFCVLAMCIVLPALLLLTERSKETTESRSSLISGGHSPAHLQQRPMALLAIAGIGTAALAIAIATSVRFEENLLTLQAEGLESVEWEHRVIENDASASWFAAAIAQDLQEVLAITQKADVVPEIGSVRSVLDLIQMPTPKRTELQKEFQHAFDNEYARENKANPITSPKLQNAAKHVRALAAVSPTLIELAQQLEILAEQLADPSQEAATLASIDRARENARGAIQAMESGNADTLRSALPSALRDMFIAPSGRFMVMLTPEENAWDYEHMAEFVTAIRNVDPDVTGVPITQFESMNDMRTSFILMGSLALLLVILFVWIDFRSVRDTFLVLVTLATGLIWTIGLISLMGVSLNLANFFAIPILMGIGVDSAIHMLHRAREEGNDAMDFGSTRRAVILTALTTAIGFGMLFFASHRGLQSLGIVMAVGSLSCLLAAIVLLPALLKFERPASR